MRNLMAFSEWFSRKTDAYKGERLNTKSDAESKPRKPVKETYVNTHAAIDNVNDFNDDKNDTKNARKCRVCKLEECANLKNCKEFLAMDVSCRWKIINTNRLCRSCLRFHRGYPCKNAKTCGTNDCKFYHHPLLHSEKTTPTSSSNEASSSPTAQTMTHHSNNDPSVLFRIVPCTVGGPAAKINTFAFLDDGSSITLIQEDLAQELGLTGENDPLCLRWTSDTSRFEKESMRVSFSVSASKSSKSFSIGNAHTVKNLGLPTQSLDLDRYQKECEHLVNVPAESYQEATPRLLIGLDNWHLGTPLKLREGKRSQPVAIKTRLGWCVYGTCRETSEVNYNYHHRITCCECEIRDDKLHEEVKNYFTTESLGVMSPKQQTLSMEDTRAIAIMEKTTKRIDGRFEVGLLWKTDDVQMPGSLFMAEKRMTCLFKKMVNDPALADALNGRIQEYLSKGYAKKLRDDEVNPARENNWYLPVFPVSNPNKPGKWRLVWDAAAKSNGVSLNSMLLKGPDMLTSLPFILFRFRERPIGITADIQEMFHQVRVRSDDQHSQLFLWPDKEGKFETYVMKVMTFGASCSPTCAQFIKNQNAEEHSKDYPNAAEAIVERHYVDDYLDSVNTVEEAIRLANDVTKVHKLGGFHIRNWVSNSERFMTAMNNKPEGNDAVVLCSDSGENKILGMWWSTQTDEFFFKLTKSEKNKAILVEGKHPTKREILRVAMSIYDPLGLLANITIYVKVMIQDIWRAQAGWDDPIPEEILCKWNTWVELLPAIEAIKIPRCYNLSQLVGGINGVELHIFSDASEKAYATVGYLRTVDQDGTINVALAGSKTKVAPLKLLSIPRLELQSCVIGARLAKSIVDGHSLKIASVQFWSDSRTALGWIKSDHRRYKQFVAFRVAEILETTSSDQWRHVPSKLNAADSATKWPKTLNVENMDSWITGPEFLYTDKTTWPTDISEPNITEELRPHILHHRTENKQQPLLDVSRYSSWNRLQRCMANVHRFVWNVSSKVKGRTKRIGPITKEDLEESENYLFRLAQHEGYPDEIAILTKRDDEQVVTKNSFLYHYHPYTDESGVLRTMGRIDASKDASWKTKRPVFLPAGHHVTTLVIASVHEQYLHANFETVVNELRQLFCIPRLRVQLKKIINNCQHCKIQKAKPVPPLMGELPPARMMTYTRPFSYIGVDYFGPMHVKIGRSEVKRWGVLVTCLTTRALHIEISATLSTDSCIQALRRVFARRGTPNEIYSDHGTNFKGASVELQRSLALLDTNAMAKEFNRPNTKWCFISPLSPHMGGSWERLVRSVKVTLTKIMPQRNPSEETLHSMLVEVENIINSRPLTYIPLTNENDEALTPNHFILGSSNGLKPLGLFTDDAEVLRKNYHKAQQFSNHFWRRWIDEYLPHLTRRSKWCKLSRPIKEGDVVYIVDSNSPTNCWPKGRVIKTIMGSNNQVRRVVVRTQNGTYERPAVKIAVLDVNGTGKSSEDVVPGGGVTNGMSALLK